MGVKENATLSRVSVVARQVPTSLLDDIFSDFEAPLASVDSHEENTANPDSSTVASEEDWCMNLSSTDIPSKFPEKIARRANPEDSDFQQHADSDLWADF